jgi:phenylacetate-CoA ligase
MYTNGDAHELRELLNFVRKNTPYYKNLYQHVSANVYDLDTLPTTDPDEYWRLALQDMTSVLTAPFNDGSPIRSGGSTNVPKMCFITRDEIAISGKIMGTAWVEAGLLKAGDRIANLYSFGGMYGGFQFVNKAIEHAPVPVVHLPLSSTCPFDQVEHEIEAFQVTVILAPVFHITRLADQIRKSGKPAHSIRVVLFSGESLSAAVAAIWRVAFPSAVIHPSMYSSVDSGGLAVIPKACPSVDQWHVDLAADPVYRVVPGGSVMELLDDEGAIIDKSGIPGHVFMTSLVRRLQPMIRYPTGDMAVWLDYGANTFKFLGRGSMAVKIVSSWLDLAMLKKMLGEVLETEVSGRLQCIIRHEGLVSVLVLRIALPPPASEDVVREQVETKLREVSSSWGKSRDAGRIAPLRFEWVEVDGLVFLEKSGKLKEVLDERV